MIAPAVWARFTDYASPAPATEAPILPLDGSEAAVLPPVRIVGTHVAYGMLLVDLFQRCSPAPCWRRWYHLSLS